MIPLTHRKEIIKGVEGEIKMICKDSLIKGLDNSKLDYGILMFGMLFSARVELRSRLEIPDYETWFPDVLVTELDGDQLQLRCFNIKTVYGFQLIDANAVSGCMPYCEKLFVKICSVMGNEHCAVVKEAETVAVVAARTMNLFYRSVINAHNVENMLTACQLFPLFMLGVVSQLQEGLDLVFGHLNRIQMTMRI